MKAGLARAIVPDTPVLSEDLFNDVKTNAFELSRIGGHVVGMAVCGGGCGDGRCVLVLGSSGHVTGAALIGQWQPWDAETTRKCSVLMQNGAPPRCEERSAGGRREGERRGGGGGAGVSGESKQISCIHTAEG